MLGVVVGYAGQIQVHGLCLEAAQRKKRVGKYSTCTMAVAGPIHVSAVTYAKNNMKYERSALWAISVPIIAGAAST